MSVSWKSLLALVFALAIQFTAIQLLAPPTHWLCPAQSKSSFEAQLTNPRQTHVLLLTSTRCGSSFVGQLLNQHPDVFYLFEPLYHVQLSFTGKFDLITKLIAGASRDLLWSLFQCDLYALENYIRPQPSKHLVNNLFCWDSDRVLCHTPICKPTKPNNWAEGDCKQCNPVNLTRAGEFCSTRSHVAYKTVRLVGVDTVRPLLEDPRLNIKVLQLVRDPRGILNSRIDLFSSWYKPWYTWKTTGKRPASLNISPPLFSTNCQEFYSSVSTGLSQPEWLRGRYMLLRYEDIAMNPLQKTKEIYDFLGLNLTSSVEKWINENTKSSDETEKKLGTKRNSATVTESWRRKLPLDMVLEAQNQCLHYMRLVGYRPVQSQEDLLNMNVSTVEERLFEPFV